MFQNGFVSQQPSQPVRQRTNPIMFCRVQWFSLLIEPCMIFQWHLKNSDESKAKRRLNRNSKRNK